MAINITDGFNLNYAAPVDYRMVVANSTARLALTYKYDGLKVFQTDNRNTYVYNSSGSTWNIENYNKISGTGSTNYIPKFTGTNSTTGSWEIGNSPISASGSNVGINTNNQRGSYTYLQIGGTSLTEDPYWYAGQSLPLTIHKGGSAIIGYNWYWTGSANAYFNSATGSSQILFSDNSMSFKTRPGSGSFVYNMIINPGYVIFSDDIPSNTTKSAMIRSQGSSSYSSQTTPDFTWYGDNTTGIFMPSANFIAFTNNGTQSVVIKSNGYVGIGYNIATYKLTVSGLVQGYSDTSKTVGGQVLNVGSSTWFSDVHLLTGQVDGTNNGFIQVTLGDYSYTGSNIGLTPYNLNIQPGGGQTILPTGSTSSPALVFSPSGNAGIYSISANKIGISSASVNQITIDQYDFYANIHDKGTNGIGDSGNNASPWSYPSIASGQFTLVIGDFTSATNCSTPIVSPSLWHRTGNTVTVGGQISFTITSANIASTFKLKIPIPSSFGVDLGGLNGNNWQLNGLGKIVADGGSNSGNIATIQAYGTSTAQFKFNPSMTGAVTMVYQYTYVVGTWPNTPAPPPPPPPLD